MALAGAVLVVGASACSTEPEAERVQQAAALVAQQKTVQGDSLSTCLTDAGFVHESTYSGVQGTEQLVYTNQENQPITLNVDLGKRLVAPWNTRDLDKLRLAGCTLSDVPAGGLDPVPVGE